MKRRIIAGALCMVALVSVAANWKLTWDPSSSPTASGQRVYSSTNGTTWKLERSLGPAATTVTLSNIPASVTFFAVTATNTAGSESERAVSEILQPPGNLQIVPQ